MHSYFSLIHIAQLRSRFSAQNFCSLRSRNTARNLCLVLRSFVGSFRLVRASDTFCQDFVLVCLSIDVTGALVLLFYLHCTSWFLFLFWVHSPVLFLRTGVSVHRRDRCTCTFFSSCLVCCLFRFFFLCFGCFPVLVCLSIDVTGALVLFTHLCTDTSGLPFAVLFVLLFLFLWLRVVVLGFLFTDVTGAPASC